MNQQITCREFIDIIVDYLDGVLTEEQYIVFQQHLEICPPCVIYLKTYRESLTLVKLCCNCVEEDDADKELPDHIVATILAARRQRGTDDAPATE